MLAIASVMYVYDNNDSAQQCTSRNTRIRVLVEYEFEGRKLLRGKLQGYDPEDPWMILENFLVFVTSRQLDIDDDGKPSVGPGTLKGK